MGGYSEWLKPIFLVLGVFAFIVLLINLGDDTWGTNWTAMSPKIISLLPWLVAFCIGLYIFHYVVGRW